jgi:hypothetical protein
VRRGGSGARGGEGGESEERSRVIADGDEELLLWYEGVRVRVVLWCSLGAEVRQAQTGGDLSRSNGRGRKCRMRRVLFFKKVYLISANQL